MKRTSDPDLRMRTLSSLMDSGAYCFKNYSLYAREICQIWIVFYTLTYRIDGVSVHFVVSLGVCRSEYVFHTVLGVFGAVAFCILHLAAFSMVLDASWAFHVHMAWSAMYLLGESRGCLPILTEATASIVEIQQMDSHFREGLSESDLLANDMLTMMYCMTIMRLVNSIMEKTRKKNEISIGEVAVVIGIPRMLINIRHECSHCDLPSLRLVRLASTKVEEIKSFEDTCRRRS
ncbi:ribosomal biogenesis protein LAS1L-like protein isoform X2 [Tanacetum coccineum]